MKGFNLGCNLIRRFQLVVYLYKIIKKQFKLLNFKIYIIEKRTIIIELY